MTNKTIVLFTLLVAFVSTYSFSQNFEGVLSYSMDFELLDQLKQMGVTKEVLAEKMKKENSFSKTINCSYKNQNYLIEMIDNGTRSIYLGEDNTIYTRGKNEDLVVAIDAGIDLENLMFGTKAKIENKETDVVILGKKCNKVVITGKAGVSEYYYNSDFLKIDPELYKNHKYDMWYEFLSISKSLPLRIVKEVKGMMKIKMELINYKEEEIDVENFILPKIKIDEELSKFVPTKNQKIYKVE